MAELVDPQVDPLEEALVGRVGRMTDPRDDEVEQQRHAHDPPATFAPRVDRGQLGFGESRGTEGPRGP